LPSSSHRANASFKAIDAGSYAEVALSFDRLSELYSVPFAEELISVADVGEGQTVLDLGAGTGIVSRRVLARGARCVAANLSSGMLRTAATLSPGLNLVWTDAEQPVVKAETLDTIVSLFAMMHFPNPTVVLRECLRMLLYSPIPLAVLRRGLLQRCHKCRDLPWITLVSEWGCCSKFRIRFMIYWMPGFPTPSRTRRPRSPHGVVARRLP
jgi:SAM-dependent methyltransferase